MNIAKTLTRNSYVLFQNEKICQMLSSRKLSAVKRTMNRRTVIEETTTMLDFATIRNKMLPHHQIYYSRMTANLLSRSDSLVRKASKNWGVVKGMLRLMACRFN